MSMSVTAAEAGLIAAPWQAAEQDATLEQAAKNFYEQSKDLTQHGKKDHPTDRIVLDDVATTLALELAAQDPAHRAHSLSEYVKLPGSGDGFQITVDANGSETLNRTPDGPGGATSLPGGDAVIAQYAAAIGHTPTQDEMAGFLAAAVAGGGLPAGTSPASVQLTVTGQDGHVLATGTAAELLAQWAGLLAANEEVTPIISLVSAGSGGPQQAQTLNGTEGAAFLLGLELQAGTATGAMVAGYNSTVAYFDQIDQPMLAVAVHYEQAAQSAEKAGNSPQATLAETAAHLALQIAAEPEGQRGSLSQTLHVGGKETEVTVSQTTTDITGGAQFHDIDQGLGGIIEQVVGIVADVLSFVPVVDAIAIPVAIAVGAAEGGQDLADGNILGGVLALAGSAAGGVGQYASDIGEAIGESTADVTTAAQDVSRGVAAAQGVDGAVTGAEDGDPLAVLTSVAGGVAGSVGAGTAWGQDLAAGSALIGAGVAAAGGNWASALAATTTAAGSAGLFGTYDPDASSAAPSSADGDNPPAGWQSAAVKPVQQEDLPLLAAADPSPVSEATVDTAAAAPAAVVSTVTQTANSSAGSDAPDAPDAPDSPSQQQPDAQQAAQVQAAQREGAQATATADANAFAASMQQGGQMPSAGVQLVAYVSPGAPPLPNSPASGSPSSADQGSPAAPQPIGSGMSQVPASSSNATAGTINLGTVTVYANPPPMAVGAMTAAGAGTAAEGLLPEIGGAVLTGLGYVGRGLLALGEGAAAGVVLPAAALIGGVFWPSATSSNDTLTGQAGAGGGAAAQNKPPDSNAPTPPPPTVSPSGQATTPPGPSDPNGNSTVQGSQSAPGQATGATSSNSTAATAQDVLADSVADPDKPILKDGTLQQTKPGGMAAADADFDSMQPTNVQSRPGGVRTGTLPDGTQVIVRPKSVPSIEINPETGPSYVIRYK